MHYRMTNFKACKPDFFRFLNSSPGRLIQLPSTCTPRVRPEPGNTSCTTSTVSGQQNHGQQNHKDKDTLTVQKNILTYASNVNSDIESEVKSKPIQYEQQIRNWDSLHYKVIHVIIDITSFNESMHIPQGLVRQKLPEISINVLV